MRPCCKIACDTLAYCVKHNVTHNERYNVNYIETQCKLHKKKLSSLPILSFYSLSFTFSIKPPYPIHFRFDVLEFRNDIYIKTKETSNQFQPPNDT